MPPWDSWDPATLPSCHHWRNAHEVVYPYVGANCVDREHEKKESLSQVRTDPDDGEKEGDKMPPWDSWNPDTLPLCKHWRNAHEVPYPLVGANCVPSPRHLPPEVKHEPLTKDALVQKRSCEPWNVDDLGSCKDRKPAHEVPYPYVGANCDPNKPGTPPIPALAEL